MDNPISGTPAVTTPAATAATPKATPVTTAKVETPVKVDDNGVAADAPKEIWKLKVDGKEMEYDASNKEKLKNDIQKVLGIEEKAKTASEKASQAENLIHMMQNDYKGFVKQCKANGINAEKLASDILYDVIVRSKMTPEQIELEEYKEREAEAKAKSEADAEAAQTAAAQKKTNEWAQKFENECSEALKAASVPKTRLSVALIAQYIDAGLKNKQDYTVAQVLPFVQRDLKAIHLDTIDKLDGEELLDYIGETGSNKIAKARVDRYKRTTANPVPEKKTTTGGTTSQNEKDHLDKILKTKGPRAYWAEMRRIKSEQGIGMRFE